MLNMKDIRFIYDNIAIYSPYCQQPGRFFFRCDYFLTWYFNYTYNKAMGQVFDELVGHLSNEERVDLLEKIQASYADTSEPIHDHSYEQPNLERVYNQMSFFEKVVVFLKMLFLSKNRLLVVEEVVYKRMFREIEEFSPGMIDMKKKRILLPFFLRIEELRKKASIFFAPFRALSEKGRADFYAFLADMEVPALANTILSDCSPAAIARKRNTDDEGVLKQEVDQALDHILDTLDPVDRQTMYYHAKCLSGLREFALYPYERILSLQNKSKEDSAEFDNVKDPLGDLINMLHTLEYRPKVVFLEGLFLYSHVEEMNDPDYQLEPELKHWMEQAKESLSFIKSFMQQVPLVKIYILMTESLDFIPRNIASGEDWFSLYRSFWHQRLDKDVKQYVVSCRKTEILHQAAHIIHKDSIVSIPHYSKSGLGYPVLYEKTFAFVNEFVRRNFALTMHTQLKRILIDGEFYKEQNSFDFSEGYSGCNRIEGRIDSLLKQLLADGEYGSELERIKNEPIPAALREKKKAQSIKKIETEVSGIVKDGTESFHLLISVLNGILFGEKGGRFDTLSNLGYMGGKENQIFMRKIGEVLDNLQAFYSVLIELIDLEEKGSEMHD